MGFEIAVAWLPRLLAARRRTVFVVEEPLWLEVGETQWK